MQINGSKTMSASDQSDQSLPLPDEMTTEGPIRKNNRFGTKFKLYVGYFLSRWGDRMWMFALSIVLGSIGSHNMQLVAVNGFVNSIAVLLFASSVGRWIDKTPRLKAATTVLIINNFSVALSAGLLVIILLAPHVTYLENFDYSPGHTTLITRFLVGGSILLCAVSTLASCGTKICIAKDWVVVISNGDKELLAGINAWMVRLDLTSMVLSPLIAGQIMTSFGQSWGCIYIAAWNALSFIIEYFVLRSLFFSCPALAIKSKYNAKNKGKEANNDDKGDCEQCHLPVCSCVYSEDVKNLIPEQKTVSDSKTSSKRTNNGVGQQRRRLSSVHDLAKPIRSIFSGWISYYRQNPTCYAGFGLALLYLTVLGLDGITTVYVYSQGLRENIVALSRGAGAIVGILGSVAYPYIRSRSGLVKTGIYALVAQVACNFLAVLSIWLPGSPFDPVGYFWPQNFTIIGYHNFNDSQNTSINRYFTETATGNANFDSKTMESGGSNASILAFLAGIVLARFGLWMADLAIGQIMQENIADHERGVINGVQHSLNQCFNMIKDILVILLPDPHTFGILIIISCCSVCSGFASYVVFAKKSFKLDAVAFQNGNNKTNSDEDEQVAFLDNKTSKVGTNLLNREGKIDHKDDDNKV